MMVKNRKVTSVPPRLRFRIEELTRKLIEGIYSPNDRVITSPQLAREAGVGRKIAVNELNALVEQGLLTAKHGGADSGYYPAVSAAPGAKITPASSPITIPDNAFLLPRDERHQRDRTPIADHLRSVVLLYPPGTRLPTSKRILSLVKVRRQTLLDALNDLKNSDVIETRTGNGKGGIFTKMTGQAASRSYPTNDHIRAEVHRAAFSIRNLIESGRIVPGTLIPAVNVLELSFGDAATGAVRMLQAEGLVAPDLRTVSSPSTPETAGLAPLGKKIHADIAQGILPAGALLSLPATRKVHGASAFEVDAAVKQLALFGVVSKNERGRGWIVGPTKTPNPRIRTPYRATSAGSEYSEAIAERAKDIRWKNRLSLPQFAAHIIATGIDQGEIPVGGQIPPVGDIATIFNIGIRSAEKRPTKTTYGRACRSAANESRQHRLTSTI